MMDAFCRFASEVNERLGRAGAWFFLPLIFSVFYEVVARRVFNNPSIWSWDVAFHFNTILIILAGGYLIIYGAHIRVDIFYAKFSQRGQRLVDIVLSPFLFLGYGALVWAGLPEMAHAFQIKETLPTTFEPQVWGLKALIIIGVLLLLLQGVAQIATDLRAVITGKYLKAVGGGAFQAKEERQ